MSIYSNWFGSSVSQRQLWKLRESQQASRVRVHLPNALAQEVDILLWLIQRFELGEEGLVLIFWKTVRFPFGWSATWGPSWADHEVGGLAATTMMRSRYMYVSNNVTHRREVNELVWQLCIQSRMQKVGEPLAGRLCRRVTDVSRESIIKRVSSSSRQLLLMWEMLDTSVWRKRWSLQSLEEGVKQDGVEAQKQVTQMQHRRL